MPPSCSGAKRRCSMSRTRSYALETKERVGNNVEKTPLLLPRAVVPQT